MKKVTVQSLLPIERLIENWDACVKSRKGFFSDNRQHYGGRRDDKVWMTYVGKTMKRNGFASVYKGRIINTREGSSIAGRFTKQTGLFVLMGFILVYSILTIVIAPVLAVILPNILISISVLFSAFWHPKKTLSAMREILDRIADDREAAAGALREQSAREQETY